MYFVPSYVRQEGDREAMMRKKKINTKNANRYLTWTVTSM